RGRRGPVGESASTPALRAYAQRERGTPALRAYAQRENSGAIRLCGTIPVPGEEKNGDGAWPSPRSQQLRRALSPPRSSASATCGDACGLLETNPFALSVAA